MRLASGFRLQTCRRTLNFLSVELIGLFSTPAVWRDVHPNSTGFPVLLWDDSDLR